MSTTTPASTRPRSRRRRRPARLTVIVAAALIVSVGAACEPDVDPPRWTAASGPMTLTALGPHLLLDWPAATGGATRYQLEIGPTHTIVPIVDPTATACLLVGLDPSMAYYVQITAFDAAGNWSGTIPHDGQTSPGWRPAAGWTDAGHDGGPTRRCVPLTDTDGDRLPNALETGTGTFAHAGATGTSPTSADTDGDGLDDGDEVVGTDEGLDLPAFGVRPIGLDLLVEMDWTSAAGCTVDTTPTAALVDPVVTAFADVGVSTMGRNGIKLIVDRGQGGAFTGGGEITAGDGNLRGTYDHRAHHFAPERQGYFRYVVFGSSLWYQGNLRAMGLAERPGDEAWFGVGCASSSTMVIRQNLLMHELGHNLGLRHGGHESMNWKPNYGSIMNYWYMSSGADLDCDAEPESGQQRLAFSEVVRPSVDENHLDEVAGICPGIPVDFNGNGVIDPVPYARELTGDGLLTVLHGSDDTDHIDLRAFVDNARMASKELIADEWPAP